MALSELSQVSERIKLLRERSGLKQYEVASAINVPPRTYQSWENGEVETDRENYAMIGKKLGASANWILFGQEEEPPTPSPPGHQTIDATQINRIERKLDFLIEHGPGGNEAWERAKAHEAEVVSASLSDAAENVIDQAQSAGRKVEAPAPSSKGSGRKPKSAPQRRSRQ